MNSVGWEEDGFERRERKQRRERRFVICDLRLDERDVSRIHLGFGKVGLEIGWEVVLQNFLDCLSKS